jgi:ubiquinone biosynthesis accessory factor UbiJ
MESNPRPPHGGFSFSQSASFASSASACLALNHLLNQHAWARELLAQHAGSRLEFRSVPLPTLRLEITPAGLLAPAQQEAGDLIVTINPLALPLLALRSPRALAYMDMAGPAGLAETIKRLLLELNWDFEEDLSRFVGDAAAHGLAEAGRQAYAWQRDAAERLAHNFSEYWTEEQPLLARRIDLEHFARQLQEFEAELARAAARLAKFRPEVPKE